MSRVVIILKDYRNVVKLPIMSVSVVAGWEEPIDPGPVALRYPIDRRYLVEKKSKVVPILMGVHVLPESVVVATYPPSPAAKPPHLRTVLYELNMHRRTQL